MRNTTIMHFIGDLGKISFIVKNQLIHVFDPMCQSKNLSSDAIND